MKACSYCTHYRLSHYLLCIPEVFSAGTTNNKGRKRHEWVVVTPAMMTGFFYYIYNAYSINPYKTAWFFLCAFYSTRVAGFLNVWSLMSCPCAAFPRRCNGQFPSLQVSPVQVSQDRFFPSPVVLSWIGPWWRRSRFCLASLVRTCYHFSETWNIYDSRKVAV